MRLIGIQRVRGGFTMIEVLFAIGIFAIGFAMVATIFPAAVLIQKNTIDDVNSIQVARNAEGMLKGRGINETELKDLTEGLPSETSIYGDFDTDQRVHRIPSPMLFAGTAVTVWTLNDRSFPTTISDPLRRRYFWVPMIKMVGRHRWEVYVFVLQRREGADYKKANPTSWANPDDGTPLVVTDPNSVPGVRGEPVALPTTDDTRFNFPNQDFDDDGANEAGLFADELLVQIGNQILDSNGIVHTVVFADSAGVNVNSPIPGYPNKVSHIWFGAPAEPGHNSTTQRILILSDDVVNVK